MRIGIEATAAARPVKTGIARYAIHLMRALAALPTGDRTTHYYRLSRRWKSGYAPVPVEGVPIRWFQEPLWPLRPALDVVHGLDGRVPRWRGVVRIATVHDLYHLRGTAAEAGGSRGTDRLAVVTRDCDRLIADSAATRDDLVALFDVEPERVDVVHLGVDERFRPHTAEEQAPVRERYSRGLPYLLYVGDSDPRKNLPRTIEAFDRSGAGKRFGLLIAGTGGGGSAAVREALARASAPVQLLGYVPEVDLPALYAGAEAFLFPTLYEGFGLPVLEAMASGTAVLGGAEGSVPEIAGEHAVLVDPRDTAAIANGIDRVLAHTDAMREAARQHAAAFTWERCAVQTRAVYERALADSRGRS